MNSILLGLYSLASIVGISSGTNFEVTHDDYVLIANTINSPIISTQNGIFIQNVEEYDDIYTIYGENRYLEVETKSGGYLIFDKKDNVVIEYNLSLSSPYENYDGNLKILNDESTREYIVFNNDEEFILINKKKELNNYEIVDLSEGQSTLSAGQYDSTIVPGKDAVLIDYAFYFENLKDFHGNNDSDICTIIATQIILGYYDTFANDKLVNDIYDKIAIETSNTKIISNFSQSPGTGKQDGIDSDQRFRDYLVDLTTQEIGESPVNQGMSTKEQIKLVKRYLNDSKLAYKLSTCEGHWLDDITNHTKKIIRNTIDAGRPVLCNGSGHSTVAYGYDDDYVYVHTGWGWTAATPWSTFTTEWIEKFDTGAIDIQLTCSHYHSDNYYSQYYDEFYCVCGFKYSNAIFNPEDYGFVPQYFFTEKTKEISYRNYTINTNRLRTGYIEEEYINLSARRLNAGKAYLEYHLPSYIKKIIINISFWSNGEMFVSGLDRAEIQYLNSNGEWKTFVDLLDDVELSKDRSNQNTLVLYFPEKISSFRIYAENDALGDRNKGRISIGKLEIMHE